MIASCARTIIIETGEGTGTDAGGPRDAGAFQDVGQPDGTLTPVRAVVASTWAPESVCAADNVLSLDGAVAGLDLFGSVMAGCHPTIWPDSGACGCVAVDFGQEALVRHITVHAGAASDACGRACVGSQCDSGHTATVSYGRDQTSYWDNPIDVVMSSPTIEAYDIEVNDTLRWVVVCRIGFSADRDDFVVDAITATLR